jgi:hypothetical protein
MYGLFPIAINHQLYVFSLDKFRSTKKKPTSATHRHQLKLKGT